MLHIIQSRRPISVADINLCVVSIKKMSEVNIQKKYEKMYVKAA